MQQVRTRLEGLRNAAALGVLSGHRMINMAPRLFWAAPSAILYPTTSTTVSPRRIFGKIG